MYLEVPEASFNRNLGSFVDHESSAVCLIYLGTYSTHPCVHLPMTLTSSGAKLTRELSAISPSSSSLLSPTSHHPTIANPVTTTTLWKTWPHCAIITHSSDGIRSPKPGASATQTSRRPPLTNRHLFRSNLKPVTKRALE